jgi:sugar-specific transcriptional regulator TrmB
MGQEEELISALADFDLDSTDSLLYISLLQTGPATVNVISTKLGLEKGKIYRSIHKLQNLGIISATLSNPTICTAIEPQKALFAIIRKKEEQIVIMKKAVERLSKKIETFQNPHQTVSQIPSFYVVQGRSNVYTRIGNIIEEATKTVYIVTTTTDLLRMNYTAVPDKIISTKKKGIQVRIITDADNKGLAESDGYEDAEIRMCMLPSKSRIVVSEDGRLVMSGSMNDSMSLNDEVDSTMYTNSPEFIKNMFSFCTYLWGLATPLTVDTKLREKINQR